MSQVCLFFFFLPFCIFFSVLDDLLYRFFPLFFVSFSPFISSFFLYISHVLVLFPQRAFSLFILFFSCMHSLLFSIFFSFILFWLGSSAIIILFLLFFFRLRFRFLFLLSYFSSLPLAGLFPQSRLFSSFLLIPPSFLFSFS